MIRELLGYRRVRTTVHYARLALESVKTSASRVVGSIGSDFLGDDGDTPAARELGRGGRAPLPVAASHARGAGGAAATGAAGT